MEEIGEYDDSARFNERMANEFIKIKTIDGSKVKTYYKGISRKAKKKKIAKKVKNIARTIKYGLYKIAHLGKEHPEKITNDYIDYVRNELYHSFCSGETGEENLQNINRRYYFEDTDNGGVKIRCGEKIFNDSES